MLLHVAKKSRRVVPMTRSQRNFFERTFSSNTKVSPQTAAAAAIMGVYSVIQRGGGGGGGRDGTNSNTTSSGSSSTTQLVQTVVDGALQDANLKLSDIDGFIAVPSLHESHFMESHYQAQALGLFHQQRNLRKNNKPPLQCRTIDTGGAGPVSAILQAQRMILHEDLHCVAVVAADTVGSMPTKEFFKKADQAFMDLQQDPNTIHNKSSTTSTSKPMVKSPAIPFGYNAITEYQMNRYGLTRDQLRMVVCLESFHASYHPQSLYYQRKQKNNSNNNDDDKNSIDRYGTPLQKLQQAKDVTPNISILECAQRADGAGCILVVSQEFLQQQEQEKAGTNPSYEHPMIVGSGEYSGPLYPLETEEQIEDWTYDSCQFAMNKALATAGNLTTKDIQFFGLYDCFPICFIRAIEACGLAPIGDGGKYVQEQYVRLVDAIQQTQNHRHHGDEGGENSNDNHNNSIENLLKDPTFFPINTHGGLLCFGAPWEVPAIYNIVEAVHQLRGNANGRSIENCHRALVYGNGGVLSASAVAILENPSATAKSSPISLPR